MVVVAVSAVVTAVVEVVSAEVTVADEEEDSVPVVVPEGDEVLLVEGVRLVEEVVGGVLVRIRSRLQSNIA